MSPDPGPRVCLGQYHSASDEFLTFAKQLGVGGVQINLHHQSPDLSYNHDYLEFDDLRRMSERIYAHGLAFEAIENIPHRFYLRAILGLEGRDAQIENYQRTVENVGRVGIPVLGINWMANFVWRTSPRRGRGAAIVTAFDLGEAQSGKVTMGMTELAEAEGRVFTEPEVFENYVYFMEQVVPVAEEAGVTIALHPDDPPVESLDGIARAFHKPAGLQRALEEVPSPSHAIGFCMGTFSSMSFPDTENNEAVLASLEQFATKDQIAYVHFRDVQGSVPRFQECFPGEGNVDMVSALSILLKAGFTGFLIDDHVPEMIGDSDWSHRGHAYATGYMMGLVDSLMRTA